LKRKIHTETESSEFLLKIFNNQQNFKGTADHMEIAAQVDTSNSDFKTEKTNPQAKITGVHESLLQECEKDIIWYRDNFFGKSELPFRLFPSYSVGHSNFLATESPKGPLAISVVREDSHFKVLVRSTTGSERLVVQTSSIPTMFLRKLLGLGPSLKEVLIASASPNVLPSLDYIKLCKDPSVPSDLLAMEERQVIRSYKFGLCNLAPGECTEDAFFKHSYDKASPAYKNFLSFLGERIELKGWKGYKAGLDVTSNQTGY
jgi:RAP1 GTPase activating protein 1